MADNDMLNRSEQGPRPGPLQGPNGAAQIELFDDEEAGRGILRSRLVLLALRHRRALITSALCAMAIVFVLTKFVMHKKYQAQAMIRPVSQDQTGLSGLLQSTGLMPSGSSLGAGLGMSGPPDPNELTAILQSYAFTTSMVDQEHLAPKLLKGSHNLRSLIPFLGPSGPPSPYMMYLLMSSRFDCDLSVRTGNMSLSFIDKNPELARRILDLYISRLRDQVRVQTVRDNKAALDSLEAEVARTADPLLRDQLYQLVGLEMQQVKTAQANADFAFTVIEPAYVPPYPCKPWVVFDTVAAGILVTLMVFCGLAIRDLMPSFRSGLAELEAEADADLREPPVPARKPPARVPVPEEDRPYSL